MQHIHTKDSVISVRSPYSDTDSTAFIRITSETPELSVKRHIALTDLTDGQRHALIVALMTPAEFERFRGQQPKREQDGGA
jgi:hypothetical protein